MLSSVRQQRSLNTQAAKAILTQLYVKWASDPVNMRALKGKIQEVMAAAATKAATAVSPASAKAAGAYGSRFADPNSGVGAPSSSSDATAMGGRRTDSPPATPPAKGLKAKMRPDEMRTPSPVQPGAGGNRFLGVDELDYPHRATSPGVAPASPLSKPVIDPMAPLPGQAHGSGATSPPTPGTGSSSSGSSFGGGAAGAAAGIDTAAAAVFGDVMPTNVDLNATVNRDSGAGRFVHSSGGYAASAPANAPRATLKDIPTFYTKKDSKGTQGEPPTDEVQRLVELFNDKVAGGGTPMNKLVRKSSFGDISVQVFKVPIWMMNMLFEANAQYVGAPKTAETLTPTQVTKYYNEKLGPLTPSRRLFELIRGQENSGREYLTIDDLKAMVRYLVAAHPGLEFLQQPEFQDYYCRTVAIRIMYALERQQNRIIYWRDFDRSDLPEVIVELDSKDVNQVLEYFSYEHFYVLYCKFWELDTDRDLLVDYSDLCNYGQGSVVPFVIRRVVDGYGRRLTSGQAGRLDFEDFVYFCLSEEDKNSEPAVYYWFKVLDVDGDGVLSGYELMEFYKENQQRFQEYFETPEGEIAYEDILCQMLDMLGFDRIRMRRYGVTLGDLRACPTPANFFNMVFNAPKFMLFEHRDPFAEHQQKLRPEKTDWDRFARIEYDRMASEAQ